MVKAINGTDKTHCILAPPKKLGPLYNLNKLFKTKTNNIYPISNVRQPYLDKSDQTLWSLGSL